MTENLLFQNSLAWVHYRMRGAMRSALLQGGGFFVVVGGLILAAVRADPNDSRSILHGWLMGLLSIQIGILLLYGAGAVRNAIRKDVTTGMIASHRLMPVSGPQAVVGYILGACPQALTVALANLLLGMLVAGPAGRSPVDWVMANALLLLFAACAYVVVACASLISAKSAGGALVAIVLLSMSGGVLLTLVPALTVICSPLLGSTIFGIVSKGAAWSPLLHVSILAQLGVTAFFFIAAARKYQRDDNLALPPWLGMIALTVFVVISLFGILNWTTLQPMLNWNQVRGPQVLGSMAAASFLALLPLSSATWLQEEHLRRQLLADPTLGRKPLNGVVLALVAALMITAIPALAPPNAETSPLQLLSTAVCLAAALVPLAYLFRLIYRTRATLTLLTGVWIACTWLGPWVVAFGVMVVHGLEQSLNSSIVWSRGETNASFSPVGALLSIWTSTEHRYLPGLGFQVVLAVLVAIFYHTRRPSSRELYVPVPPVK